MVLQQTDVDVTRGTSHTPQNTSYRGLGYPRKELKYVKGGREGGLGDSQRVSGVNTNEHNYGPVNAQCWDQMWLVGDMLCVAQKIETPRSDVNNTYFLRHSST